jgi:hypothetical protein
MQETHNQLWSHMSEGGERKPKRLIIYKTHIFSYDHPMSEGPPSDIGDHSWLCVSCIWLVFLVFVLLLQTYEIITDCDTHNQLWSPMSEGGKQKP